MTGGGFTGIPVFPDIEDALALGRYRERRSAGAAAGIPHDAARGRLGLEAEGRIG
ncbi:hypothetical protein [Streptomyces netropsis]|uniref:Uncharacterized protein n=1 Tax=Streptomyces netropsis TaxID=55404 RepID=A0A7W7L8U2_STRNE|nr:hypothetical protein [Streptomyces netropsis]MBB4885687.1 hypothetical protein [Streptomyces netropsis]GGR36538.1 hypothetical protein GCM10010219_46860 [Streptomyces netropsis]